MNKNQTMWNHLGDFITETMKKENVPGVVIGILHQDKKRTVAFGVTNIEHPLPVTTETLFQIGSITKTFTTTLIMRLVEKGILDLDVPVRTYVPDFKLKDEKTASQVTIRHLLTHTGGWEGDYFDDTGSDDGALARYVANMAELEQLVPLGSILSYNNSAFILASYIIETVTGKRYSLILKEKLFEPLGLNSCCFSDARNTSYPVVAGHIIDEMPVEVIPPWQLPRSSQASGGIICHIDDILTYAKFHLGDGKLDNQTTLLSPESMHQMQSPQVPFWINESLGLPWGIDDRFQMRRLWHQGATMGQRSLLDLIPEHQFALAIFTNADRGRMLHQMVRRWIYKQYFNIEMPFPTPIEVTKEELATYVGFYTRPMTDIRLNMSNGKLNAEITFKYSTPTKNSPPSPPLLMNVTLCEKDRLLILDGYFKNDTIDVFRGSDGSIIWIRLARRVYVKN